MGVPAFFRWLSKKYPSIIVHCVEEKGKEVNDVKIPVDLSQPNPNNVEFDNLYLDMNGIIHPCCHPENKPAPKNEDEMMVLIFEYIDRLMSIVRPRKLLYMAIDGVAPRAKMNQQRSRRFRASKESREKRESIKKIRREIIERGGEVPPEKAATEHFDSNCITPGTEFMAYLAECLRYYVTDRLNNHPGWKDLKVILSDANAPGEGEHKIMDYIRRQRPNPDHDPNTHHCLCGADADLIMLGLATHEPNFTIIREEFKPNQPRACDICGQTGHEMDECEGLPKTKSGEHDELSKPIGQETEFIFLRLNILREYLEKELWMTGLPFPFDIERAIDDWVFMCFFVGNDFLPHLPSLSIREGAIDRLIRLYKKAVYKTNGYLTENGIVNLSRVQMILQDLGEAEDEIFKKRRESDLRFRKINQNKKRRELADAPQFVPSGFLAPTPIGQRGEAHSAKDIRNAVQDATLNLNLVHFREEWDRKNCIKWEGAIDRLIRLYKKAVYKTNADAPQFVPSGFLAPTPIGQRGEAHSAKDIRDAVQDGRNQANKNAADALRSQLNGGNDEKKAEPPRRGTKRTVEDMIKEDAEQDQNDAVKLWEDGWRERYYQGKFDVQPDDHEFRHKVGAAYALGLCWVLQYYYQGCASWDWYFPYHYAPFASDFVDIDKTVSTKFPKGTKPFKPLEQLMSVFPAASGNFLPTTWRSLMSGIDSPIIDFYPDDFKIDLNGKKYAWQGVALLPFVDEGRLLETLGEVYPNLAEEEKMRNSLGPDRLFVGKDHPLYSFIEGIYEGGKPLEDNVTVSTELSQGMAGEIWCDKYAVQSDGTKQSPLPMLPDIKGCKVMSCAYKDPDYGKDYLFKCNMLPGAKLPDKVLKPEDFEKTKSGNQQWRPRIGFSSNFPRASLGNAGHRMVNHYSSIPPPKSLMGQAPRYDGQRSRSGGQSYPDYGQGGGRNNRGQGSSGRYGNQGGGGGGYYGGQGGGGGGNYYGDRKGGYGGQSHYGGGSGGGGGGYQQSYSGGGQHGWNRNMQAQQSAYYQNQQRYQQQQHQPYQQQQYNQGRRKQRDDRYRSGANRSHPYPPPLQQHRRY
ncbi:5'-3' exoribonuclease 2-like [Anneissia japonica]|uniref:5'-3' exoribonuclease 2-like n=1 Tax=Anneissia japonica TaxID=1529436 RepID=UPI00142578D4|nr:5'-3' exoribonuclease 2-like [Anneissia japonica]